MTSVHSVLVTVIFEAKLNMFSKIFFFLFLKILRRILATFWSACKQTNWPYLMLKPSRRRSFFYHFFLSLKTLIRIFKTFWSTSKQTNRRRSFSKMLFFLLLKTLRRFLKTFWSKCKQTSDLAKKEQVSENVFVKTLSRIEH